MTVINEVDAQAADRAISAQTIRTAVLDKAHLGDIHGALGSIAEDDFAPRSTLGARLKTLLAILGLLDTPTDGTYYLNGKPVTGLKLSERARIRNGMPEKCRKSQDRPRRIIR